MSNPNPNALSFADAVNLARPSDHFGAFDQITMRENLKVQDAMRRAELIAEAEIVVDKDTLTYDADGSPLFFETVVAGLILFTDRNELEEFDSSLYVRAYAEAKEIAADKWYSDQREQRARNNGIRE